MLYKLIRECKCLVIDCEYAARVINILKVKKYIELNISELIYMSRICTIIDWT